MQLRQRLPHDRLLAEAFVIAASARPVLRCGSMTKDTAANGAVEVGVGMWICAVEVDSREVGIDIMLFRTSRAFSFRVGTYLSERCVVSLGRPTGSHETAVPAGPPAVNTGCGKDRCSGVKGPLFEGNLHEKVPLAIESIRSGQWPVR